MSSCHLLQHEQILRSFRPMKLVRKSQIPYDFTYTCNLKDKTNKRNKTRLTDTVNRLVVARGEEEVRDCTR